MENKGISTDYQSLCAKGLTLSENNFNLIRSALLEGAQEAKNYLKIESDDWPKFNFSNDANVLGYSTSTDAICLSINHLNQATSRATELPYKDQLLMFIPDSFYIIVKYMYWLKLLGRESTVHRYQHTGNEMLKVKFPTKIPPGVSTRLLYLSDVEVEARKIIDGIISFQGENHLWIKVDEYFRNKFPQYYNKSIEELSKLPKPDFSLSAAMEYYAV